MATIQWDVPAATTIMTTELNALANATGALSVEYDNSSAGYDRAILELNFTCGSNPTAGRTLDVFQIITPDSAAGGYDDSWNNPAAFKGGIPAQVNTSAQKVSIGGGQQEIVLFGGKVKFRVYSNLGVSLSASGHTLKLIPGRHKTV